MKLTKTYEPSQFEADIYMMWEDAHAFAPTGEGEPYSIVLPPPNANGNLHLGHALTAALQDILTRYHRMNGHNTIWIPGSDHAGFETWVVFERKLETEGKSRFDFSREELYRMTWDFVAEQRGNMENQMRRLGSSVDWSQMTFTLDQKVVDRVYKTFKKMWDDDLIYRGKRIVNYCTVHQTSFADIEVEYEEEKGKLWEIKYLGVDFDGEIIVATTRPETMLGDEAIAVHPDDVRFRTLVGKHVLIPILGKKIPIIADEAVELGFGTGAVKVTPAHDPLDFEIGERHGLPVTEVIGQDGRMTNVPEDFLDLEVKFAREKVVERLKKEGSLGEIKDFDHQVPHCYKCGSVIEPLVKDQWFVAVKKLTTPAKKAIKDGKIRVVPANKRKEMERYYSEMRDWNISRQIPWGIPIPAFRNTTTEEWIFDERVDQKYLTINGEEYERDDDTFDTWFSSSQWPVILTESIPQFYPTSVMETAPDILRQWVSRMVMLGLYINGDVPFKNVYYHGLILDEHSQKMSKSKGNVINPMELVNEFGSDALRLGIVSARSAGVPQAFSPDKVLAGRNFCNKLWNIARFIELSSSKAEGLSTADHWVLSKLQQLTDELDKLLKDYRFAEAIETLYHTIWDDVADWYVEAAKQGTAIGMEVLETILRLVHPFAPFVTEAIWTTLKDDSDLLIGEQWRRDFDFDPNKAAEFEEVRNLITTIRPILKNLGHRKRVLNYRDEPVIAGNEAVIKSMLGLEGIFPLSNPHGVPIAGFKAYIEAKTTEISAYKAKLEQKLIETGNLAENLKKRLAGESYVKNAPKHLVEETRQQLAEAESLSATLGREIENID
jgi:valyl-tRNA synthetase